MQKTPVTDRSHSERKALARSCGRIPPHSSLDHITVILEVIGRHNGIFIAARHTQGRARLHPNPPHWHPDRHQVRTWSKSESGSRTLPSPAMGRPPARTLPTRRRGYPTTVHPRWARATPSGCNTCGSARGQLPHLLLNRTAKQTDAPPPVHPRTHAAVMAEGGMSAPCGGR
jgi:hypothetical protein